MCSFKIIIVIALNEPNKYNSTLEEIKNYCQANADIELILVSNLSDLLRVKTPHIILLDLNLGDNQGLETFKLAKSKFSKAQIISINTDPIFAEYLFSEGVNACLPERKVIEGTIQHLELAILKESAKRMPDIKNNDIIEFNDGEVLICADESTKEAINLAIKFAIKNKPILILGDTGTGKGVLAKYLHYKSRPEGKYEHLNLNSLNVDEIPSKLFGYEKGSHNLAKEKTDGIVQSAEGGTLFLDEIGDFYITHQGILLTLIENKNYMRYGASNSEYIKNILFIAATNKDVNDKRIFREDLRDRFEGIITLAPLSERPKDFDSLIDHFIIKLSILENRNIFLTTNAKTKLKNSNINSIRKLRTILERAISKTDSNTIEACDIDII